MMKKDRLKDHGQMIVLMGIVLAISVFMISSLAAEIVNVNFMVTTGETSSLLTDFAGIRETFGITLNYNLVDIEIDVNDESTLKGDITSISGAFNETRYQYLNISLLARLNSCLYSHEEVINEENTIFYTVDTTLYLDCGRSSITEDVVYIIACNPVTS